MPMSCTLGSAFGMAKALQAEEFCVRGDFAMELSFLTDRSNVFLVCIFTCARTNIAMTQKVWDECPKIPMTPKIVVQQNA